MKKLIFLLGFLFTMYGLTGQPWPSIIGEYGVLEEGRQIIEHYDNGFLITSSRGYGYDLHSGLIVKTNINGQVLWDKEIGIAPDQIMIDKTLYDEEGNIYVFGLIIQNTQYDWPVVIKLNACGEKVWCKNLYNPDFYFGYFTDAMLLDNGDLLGLAYYPDEDQHDIIFLFCLSPDGQYKWKKSYASCDNYPNFAQRIGNALDKFGDTYIISGYVYSPYPNGNPNHVFLRPMFIGIDEEFREKWVVEFGINDSLLGIAYNTIQINDSLFMGIGTNRVNDNGHLTDNSFLMFYDNKGNEIKHHVVHGSEISPDIHQNLLCDVKKIEGEKYLCTACLGDGYMGSPMGEMIIDTSGFVYDFRIRENTKSFPHLIETFDDKFLIVCSHKTPSTNYDIYLNKINENLELDTLYPGSYTYDSLCDGTIESGVIDLTGCDVVTGIGEIPTLEEYRQHLQTIPIHASPNPSATGEILLEMENTARHPDLQLKVFDVFGKVIHTQSILPAQGALRLDTSGWNAGMYVAAVYSREKMMGKCKVVVR